MRFLHLSDLHLGKYIYGVSLIDSGDQRVWVERFLEKVQETEPDAVVIAGDIYDRSNPSGEAMVLFDHLLTELSNRGIPVLLIAGNHDSGQRISFGGTLFQKNQIYISGIADKEITHVTLPEKNGTGRVTFWLMPYIFPALVAEKLEDEDIHEYDTAVRKLLERQPIDFSSRNVLVAHQNVTAFGVEAERGGSESMVGGVGQIEYTAFDGFDYVALGHIHSSYPVGRKEIRYAGSPMCYHFDELKQPKKGPILVTLGEKDAEEPVSIEVLEIEPLHPLRELCGTYEELREIAEQDENRGEYLRIVLTDCRTTPDMVEYFRRQFASRESLVLEIVSTYQEQISSRNLQYSANDVAAMSLDMLFTEFYRSRKNGDQVGEKENKILEAASELTESQAASMTKNGTVEETEIDRLLAFVKKIAKEDC